MYIDTLFIPRVNYVFPDYIVLLGNKELFFTVISGNEFGQEDVLTENIGMVHDYLGITIDYSIKGKVVFTIFYYLEDIILECPDDLKFNFNFS